MIMRMVMIMTHEDDGDDADEYGECDDDADGGKEEDNDDAGLMMMT